MIEGLTRMDPWSRFLPCKCSCSRCGPHVSIAFSLIRCTQGCEDGSFGVEKRSFCGACRATDLWPRRRSVSPFKYHVAVWLGTLCGVVRGPKNLTGRACESRKNSNDSNITHGQTGLIFLAKQRRLLFRPFEWPGSSSSRFATIWA